MSPKEYYKNYVADNNRGELNDKLIELVRLEYPNHVLEFGCGTGKNIELMAHKGIATMGLDISMMNILKAHCLYDLPGLIKGDESFLRHLCNFDCVFTVSVLDHIQDVEGIVNEFKRIANKSVFLMETNDIPADFYYPHHYEEFGFEKLPYSWKSPDDWATYYIWKWTKQ